MKLEVRNTAFSYDGVNRIFENITFSIKKGNVFCILGPNAAGKSTLLKCIIRFLRLTEGTILLDGEDINSLSGREIAKKVGYIPQTHNPTFPFSVEEVVLMGRSPHLGLLSSPSKKDMQIVDESLKSIGISHLRDKSYTEISGGEKQLVFFARVLAQQPDVLLLDEPTAHLDFGNQICVLEWIEKLAKSGISIVMTSHFPDHTFLASTAVAIMKDGMFIDVGTADYVVTEANLKKTYGVDVRVMYMGNGVDRKVCIPLKKGNGNSDS
jgi:iron complex transport system ATP-binding protein